MKNLPWSILFFGLLSGLYGCRTIPEGATAVQPFDANRYLGKWYEIARLDFRFERHMNNTTAEYTLNDDGSIKVLNRGYDTLKQEWSEASGKARFVGEDSIAMLKVSFFGPFYGGYNVLALDEDYRYALVGGSSLKYLWILAREPSLPDSVKAAYLKQAKDIGYATEELIWVEHKR
jgi:apolipoprotein D and lipocalin family protein